MTRAGLALVLALGLGALGACKKEPLAQQATEATVPPNAETPASTSAPSGADGAIAPQKP